MILGCRFLTDVCNVNSFEWGGNFIELTKGDVNTIYFQLIDLSKNKTDIPAGLRYMPPATSTLSIVLENIDDAKKITRSAVQVYATSDPSIWSLSILSTDTTLRGTVTMRLALTEPITGGTKTIRGVMLGALRIKDY